MADQNPPQRIGGGLQPVQGASLGSAMQLPAAPESPVLAPSYVGGPSGGSSSSSTVAGGGGLVPQPAAPNPAFTTDQTAIVGKLMRMNPAGGLLNVNLPPASAGSGPVGVKVQSTSNNGVNIVPAGADTIDLAAGNYPVGGAGLGALQDVILYSDGISDWMVMT